MNFLIVFLGNPGKKFLKTRHNVGFLFSDFLQQKWKFPDFVLEKKFFGKISQCEKFGFKLFLLRPQTFMNLSGKSVSLVSNFFKIPAEKILVIFDDKDLDFSKTRIRKKGSSGGHRGVQNLIDFLGKNFSRLKIGINLKNQDFKIPTEKLVLSNFSSQEIKILQNNIFPATIEKLENFLKNEQKNYSVLY